eukprot:4888119-Pyramimonas_sp.AAC.1
MHDGVDLPGAWARMSTEPDPKFTQSPSKGDRARGEHHAVYRPAFRWRTCSWTRWSAWLSGPPRSTV